MNMYENLSSANLLLGEREMNAKQIALSCKPRTLRIILTNKCNINCIMCGINNEYKDKTLPYDKIRGIINILPYIDRIDWQGGEVFLVPYFKDLLQEVLSYKHISHTLQTSGLLLNKEWASIFAKNNISLLISVDSTKKETYEYIRKGAKFEKLLENLEILKSEKKARNSTASTIMCVCVMKSNYRELEQFVLFAKKYAVTQISLGFLHGENVPLERIFMPNDLEAVNYLSQELSKFKSLCDKSGIKYECYFEHFLDRGGADIHDKIEEPAKQLDCQMPWTNLSLDAIRDGNVYPECLCQTPVGNIVNDTIESIWNNNKMKEYRSSIINKSFVCCAKDCFRVAGRKINV